jgi:hypothetical protein
MGRYLLDWSGSGWGQVESACKYGNGHSGYIKCWEVLEWLHKCWPFEKGSAP